MELLLNLAWLVIVTAIGAAWVERWPTGDRRQFWLSLGALLCVAILLLPVISVTDDLHLEAFVVEDSNSTKRLVGGSTHANPIAPLVWFAMAVIALWFAALRRYTSRPARKSSTFYRTPLFDRSVLGRAPPAFSS